MGWRLVLILLAFQLLELSLLEPFPAAMAQIYRWDNGSLIPGTQDVQLGPGVVLSQFQLPWAALRGQDLTSSQFESANLSSSSLRFSTLGDANLRNAQLTQADLGYATLTRADLSGADLSDAQLYSVNFTKANLTGAILQNAEIDYVDFTHAMGFSAEQLYSTSSYQNGYLFHTGLVGLDLQGWNLSGLTIEGVDFTDSNLTRANLTGAQVSSGSFLNANLTGAVISRASFTRATARGLTQAQLKSTANYRAHNLDRVTLSYNDMRGWDFSQQSLIAANLDYSRLSNADFTGAVVNGMSLVATTKRGFTQEQLQSTASYRAMDLSGINLSGNDLSGWDFSQQKLRGAILEESDLSGADLANANLTRAVLVGASLEDATLSQADLQQASLQRAKLARVTLDDANLADAVLTSTDLTGASLKSANLTNAELRNSKLRGANLSGAIVQGASFSQSAADGFTFAQLKSTASYQAKDLRGVSLFGNDLTQWDLSEQNLQAANLGRSSLTDVNLTNADLSDANLESAWFRNTNLTGATIAGASFKFTTARGLTAAAFSETGSYRAKNLPGIKLTGNDLSGWDLAEQNLMDAELPPDGLHDTDLRNADLRGASPDKLPGAKLQNAIRSNGHILGLQLGAGERLLVRDDDGVAFDAPTTLWNNARDPLPITVDQQLTISDGGVLALEFDEDAWGSPIFFQPGIPVTLGGTLELGFAHDVNLAAQAGRTLQVFDWSGVEPTGSLRTHFEEGTVWDVSQLRTQGTVTLVGISSDLDTDRDVDSHDLLLLLSHWTGTEFLPRDKTWREGDSDQDGDVDSADLLTFLGHWTGDTTELPGRSARSPLTVPEPQSYATLSLFAWLAAWSTRRRFL